MTAGLQRTPLNAAHRHAGARLVDFAGWEMPLHYGSQIEEHNAVRRDTGMFDTSHMLAIDVEGSAASALLRYALANNVDKLRDPGKALYSCLLREDGGILDDLIVYFLAEGQFRVVVNAATADKDRAWLDALRARRTPEVELKPRRDLAMIAVQGPNARDRVWAALPDTRNTTESLAPFSAASAEDMFCARTGYTGEDGFELLVPAARAEEAWAKLAAKGVRPCGLAARDTLRLEAGMNLYGQDMDENVTPLESGLAWTVDSESSRDFVGKRALGDSTPTRKLVGLVLVDRGGVLRAHQSVRTPQGDGEITSGTFSPTMQQSIALARVPMDVAPGDTVEVAVRDKSLRARVVQPPFVRHGKILV
ncbi:MAG: glycine cleavage system aminomethyltransferase GcvT [Betaproteobacteria bacterium]|jgi:aminomethyltransferase|nr:glycine cleavage system aminomethyltransferase GcvT [Betaproteobacteria bacterium]